MDEEERGVPIERQLSTAFLVFHSNKRNFCPVENYVNIYLSIMKNDIISFFPNTPNQKDKLCNG